MDPLLQTLEVIPLRKPPELAENHRAAHLSSSCTGLLTYLFWGQCLLHTAQLGSIWKLFMDRFSIKCWGWLQTAVQDSSIYASFQQAHAIFRCHLPGNIHLGEAEMSPVLSFTQADPLTQLQSQLSHYRSLDGRSCKRRHHHSAGQCPCLSMCCSYWRWNGSLSVWSKICKALRPSCCCEPVLGQIQVEMLGPLVQGWRWLHSLP